MSKALTSSLLRNELRRKHLERVERWKEDGEGLFLPSEMERIEELLQKDPAEAMDFLAQSAMVTRARQMTDDIQGFLREQQLLCKHPVELRLTCSPREHAISRLRESIANEDPVSQQAWLWALEESPVELSAAVRTWRVVPMADGTFCLLSEADDASEGWRRAVMEKHFALMEQNLVLNLSVGHMASALPPTPNPGQRAQRLAHRIVDVSRQTQAKGESYACTDLTVLSAGILNAGLVELRDGSTWTTIPKTQAVETLREASWRAQFSTSEAGWIEALVSPFSRIERSLARRGL